MPADTPTDTQTDAQTRRPLSRDRVLRAAVTLADEQGLDAVTMRRLGEALGVEAMSLYNHVSNKDDLLDGMVDQLLAAIDAAARDASDGDDDWRRRMRDRCLAAHAVMQSHSWGPELIASKGVVSPRLMVHFDQLIGILLDGGFSPGLTHNAVHALGSRMLGFEQELFVDQGADSPPTDVVAAQLQDTFPNLATMMRQVAEDAATTGHGCDPRTEFAFGLELLLDGLEARRVQAHAPS